MVSGSRRVGGVAGSVLPPVTVGTSVPTIGLSRVVSGAAIGTGLAHRHSSRFGTGVSRPTSSYVPPGLSTAYSPGSGYISAGSYGLNVGTTYGLNAGTTYGISQ